MNLGGKVFILGCGNPLFGDDGFGPVFVDYLTENYGNILGERVVALDMGTAVRDFLFDVLLSSERPEKIIIVDCVSKEGRAPGDVFEMSLDEMAPEKISDFSLHQFPTTNLLKEIFHQTGVKVKVFVVQAKFIPEEVRPGLSNEVRDALTPMCEKVLKECEVLSC